MASSLAVYSVSSDWIEISSLLILPELLLWGGGSGDVKGAVLPCRVQWMCISSSWTFGSVDDVDWSSTSRAVSAAVFTDDTSEAERDCILLGLLSFDAELSVCSSAVSLLLLSLMEFSSF